MIFTPKINKNKITPVIKINDDRIDGVSEVCFLGVNIEDKINWNSHINKIARKSSRTMIGLFHNLKYYNLAWGKNITRVNKLQKSCARHYKY